MDAPVKFTYPAELPISGRVDEIVTAIRDHQVVIVAGETGSGKTTQLPKICLQAGRGRDGMIGHTQPRRLAARSVADRIASELGSALGGLVGYQVRFTDQVSDGTRVKLMTDGILLAELAADRRLQRYDTLILDEAHERSLNIDFLLGYLARLLPRRPDLKLVITSATIDPHRFAAHFSRPPAVAAPESASRSALAEHRGPELPGAARGDQLVRDGPTGEAAAAVPVIEVSGRSYPVEVRYRPPDPETDQTQAICDAVDALAAEGPGDILVFLSGEREIRDTADALSTSVRRNPRLRDTELLPLYARLSLAEQQRVFRAHPGRRIVLATNVAETSLTVPGIRYVVDPGTARISRYSQRLKVQRLPIEPISQASAIQRTGRCGRLADGICIRLYSEEDFAARPTFTEPEILRTNLASVILQMAALKLGQVTDFPFVDPPDRRQVNDGVRLLVELGAFDREHRLTQVGRKLARLPVDPRLGRMVLAADRDGCLREALVIAAALSIQDPRERPADQREAADTRHTRFADESSDFLAYLNLWRYLQERQRELSGSQLRRLCRTDFLHYLRVREWQDVHQQLRRVARTLGASLNSEPADPNRIHAALLAGLLSHLGMKDLTSKDPRRRHEYLGARGARFAIAPGSALFRKSPQWVMVAELVETSRLWGRIAAAVQPEWVEPLAGHLVSRSYSEPHWDPKRGAVVGYESITLYGLPIVSQRKVDYARIDPRLCRELFIRHALVAGEWHTHHAFAQHNRELLARAEELEHRARRRDIVVDDEVLFAFFDRRLGEEVVSTAHFDRWWKRVREDQPDLLDLSLDVLVDPGAAPVREADFPDRWSYQDLRLPLRYQFEPGQAADGVTVDVPLAMLDGAASAGLDWHVPGLRRELVVALIRSLPKPLRRQLVPAQEVASELLAALSPYQEPLLDALTRAVPELTGVVVPRSAWAPEQLPDHLRMTFRVTDEQGNSLAEGKDLPALRERLAPAVRASLSAAATGVERRGLRDWAIGDLPRRVTLTRAGHPVAAYPALVDAGDTVDVRVFATPAEQAHQHGRGTRRLLLLTTPAPARYVSQRLADDAKLALLSFASAGVRALLDDCAAAAVDALVAEAGGPAWDAPAFAALQQRVRAGLAGATLRVVRELLPVATVANQLADQLAGTPSAPLAPAVADLRAQRDALVRPGFVAEIGWSRLTDLRRWLRAIAHRREKLPAHPDRDRRAMAVVQRVQEEYAQRRAAAPAGDAAALDEIRWMIEELRVSLFAQQLGTAYPVSEKRIYRALDDLS